MDGNDSTKIPFRSPLDPPLLGVYIAEGPGSSRGVFIEVAVVDRPLVRFRPLRPCVSLFFINHWPTLRLNFYSWKRVSTRVLGTSSYPGRERYLNPPVPPMLGSPMGSLWGVHLYTTLWLHVHADYTHKVPMMIQDLRKIYMYLRLKLPGLRSFYLRVKVDCR